MLPQGGAAPARLLLLKGEVKVGPGGSVGTALQVVIGGDTFSVVIQGAAATTQVLGGSDCALGKTLR